MNKKIVLSIVAIFAALSMANFTMSQEAYAYKSDVNPIDSRNVPDSEMDREIVFPDEVLHRQLNQKMGRGDNTNPITIGDAINKQIVNPQIPVFSIGDIHSQDGTSQILKNLEGIQYFDICDGAQIVSVSGLISDFSPIDCHENFGNATGRQFNYSPSVPDLKDSPEITNLGDIGGYFAYIRMGVVNFSPNTLNNFNIGESLTSFTVETSNISDVSFLSKFNTTKSIRVGLTNANISDISVLGKMNFLPAGELNEWGYYNVNYRFGFSGNNITKVPENVYSLRNVMIELDDNKIADSTYAEELYATLLDKLKQNGKLDSFNNDPDQRAYHLSTIGHQNQRPEITVHSKTFTNPLRDKNGNSIPVQETEFIKNGENGTIVLLVNDQKGSVSTGFDNTRGFNGTLTINYDFTQPEMPEPAKESPVSDIKAPSTGFGQDYLSLVAVVILAIATLFFIDRQNKIRL
ncbi:MAG: hypothetical protein WAV68_00835 [Candidatus Nanogingivalis sp.]